MRAIQIEEFGGPEVLQLKDLPVPEPAEGEVLVKVTRAGVNFADTHQRHNQYVAKQTLPMIPGSEVAGVREDTGERVLALCGHGGYAESAPALGADAAVDGAAEGLADRLREANLGQPVDVVFEATGGQVFDESLAALAHFGRLVVYGISSREQNEVRTGRLMRNSHTVAGF